MTSPSNNSSSCSTLAVNLGVVLVGSFLWGDWLATGSLTGTAVAPVDGWLLEGVMSPGDSGREHQTHVFLIRGCVTTSSSLRHTLLLQHDAPNYITPIISVIPICVNCSIVWFGSL